MKNYKKTPPDGGYGWIIVCAVGLSNVIIIPLMLNFGLIFKDTFVAMGLSATQGALIINLNAAFGMVLGVLNGVLLKLFGYRKISFLAATLLFVGIVATSFATTLTEYIITYGIITSLGLGLSLSSNTLALNSYFTKNKSRATSYVMTLAGMGPVLMPQLLTYLIQVHTIQGVTLILGAISAHTFVAASLMQPVERHLKAEQTDEVPLRENEQNTRFSIQLEEKKDVEVEVENPAIWGMDSVHGSVISIPNSTAIRRLSINSQQLYKNDSKPITCDQVYNPELSCPKQKKPLCESIISLFDLDLLKDPIYMNMMLGMSLAVFTEMNFLLLTAFILADFGLTNVEIATFMSTLGVLDVVFRFLAPYIADYFDRPPREMFLLTLLLLIATRFVMLLSHNFYVLLGVAAMSGVARGIRIVFLNLLLPTYVPIEKFASASGMQMMLNGLFVVTGGPIVGLIRDVTGSYSWSIVILNGVTFACVIMWATEFIIVRLKNNGTSTPNIY